MKASQLALIALGLAEDYFGSYRRSLRWVTNLSGISHEPNKNWWYITSKFRRKGWIKNADKKLELLEEGRKEIFKQFPLLEWRKLAWDGKWRVVMYDIPEKIKAKRDLLRNWLKRLGMGQWQMSVWVSPHSLVDRVNEILGKTGIREYCSVHESRRVVGIPDKEFANKIWKLDELNNKYHSLLEIESRDENDHQMIFDQLIADPFLPKELLPNNWMWDEAMKKFATLNQIHDRLSELE